MSGSGGLMSVQAAEALVSTVCHHHLSSLFTPVHDQTLEDGTVLYLLGTPEKVQLRGGEKELVEVFFEKIISSAVREICGRSKISSPKCGDIEFHRLHDGSHTLQEFLSTATASGGPLSEGSLATGGGGGFADELFSSVSAGNSAAAVSAMLSLVYNDAVEATSNLTIVTRFPESMCMIPGGHQHTNAKMNQPRAYRADCILGGSVVVSAFAGTPLENEGGNVVPCLAVKARQLAKILAPHSSAAIDHSLPAQWRHKSFTLEEVEDILGAVATSILTQWNASPKNEKARIAVQALIQTVNAQLRDFLRDQLLLESTEMMGIWRMPRQSLTRVAKVGRGWQQSARELVTKRLQGWKGNYHPDVLFDDFVYRVDKSSDIRIMLELSGELLESSAVARGAGEFERANPETAFANRSAVDPAHTSHIEWKDCVKDWDTKFSDFEPRVTAKLKAAWSTIENDPEAVFSFVEHNEILLRREGIYSSLETEINKLSRDFEGKINESRKQVEEVIRRGASSIARMSAFRNSVAEIAPIAAGCSRVISNSTINEVVKQKLDEHIKHAKEGIAEALTSWISEASRRLTAGLPVIVVVNMAQTNPDDITTAVLTCTFDAQMQQIIEEAAELLSFTSASFVVKSSSSSSSASSSSSHRAMMSAIGQQFVPYDDLFGALPDAKPKQCFHEIERIYRAYFRLRQQLVVFNTLTTRQIQNCTRPLFEKVIGKCIAAIMGTAAGSPRRTFGPSAAPDLEGIVSHLQSALEHAASEWLAVRKLHAELGAKINTLFDVDLIHAQEQWKNNLKDMRNLMDSYERTRNIVAPDSSSKSKLTPQQIRDQTRAMPTFTWKQHWDYQLYKALEYQYQRGLEVLNENASTITVELHIKNGQVVFKPGYEHLREKYYERIRDFVNIPNRFKGLAGSDFFSEMPTRNGNAVAQVHTKAMDLFAKLARTRKLVREHVVIGLCGFGGSMDLDALVSHLVTTQAQWEKGFEVVKKRFKERAKLEDSFKIDCIEIDMTPVKAAVEDQLRRLEESLLASLRKASQKRLAEIDSFVLHAANVVSRQPATLEELGEMNKSHDEVKRKLPSIAKAMNEQEGLTKLLRSAATAAAAHSSSSISSSALLSINADFSITKSRWDHLQDAMSSHSQQMKGSVAKLRTNVEGMVQKFKRDVERFMKLWNKSQPKTVEDFKNRSEFIEKCLKPAQDRHVEFEELRNAAKDTIEKCDFFGVGGPDLQEMTDAEEEIGAAMVHYKFFEEFDAAVEKLRSEDWLTFRTRYYQFEDLLKTWSKKFKLDIVKTSAEAAVGPLQENDVQVVQSSHGAVAAYVVRQIVEWRTLCPLLKYVRGDGYLTDHWKEMFALVQLDKGMTPDALTFGHLVDKAHHILAKESDIKSLHHRAEGEVRIRDALQEVRKWGLDTVFTLVSPPEGSTSQKIKLISEWKEVLTDVSDFQALLRSLEDSIWFKRFADEVGGFQRRLLNLQEYMGLLNDTQRRWLYLEPLFARGALPQEQMRFKRVDKEFIAILREVESDPRVMSLAHHDDYGDKLKRMLEEINKCQKALNEFLEQKRDSFPRFYFISDEDLLEILGQSKSPTVIQSHLKKLFAGINSVRFNEASTEITHMISSDGEVVPLRDSVDITESANVEDWLIALDRSMRCTLADLMVRCTGVPTLGDILKNLRAIDAYPSQILQIAAQIAFCSLMEQMLSNPNNREQNMVQVKKQLDECLHALTGIDYTEGLPPASTTGSGSQEDPIVQKTKLVRELKVKSLVMDVIHMIEIAELLRKARSDEAKWCWQKQLRYYLEDYNAQEAAAATKSEAAKATEFDFKGKRCVVRMVDTMFRYSYEYQGNALKLVHTPLTDKCYLTLTKGMQLGFGGNLYGPAGTGKTESTKMLGGNLGRQVLVFNCDEGIDFKSMGRIFCGIVKCGAWGCFDEFNRLKVDQLSAVSQMIQGIQEALKTGEPSCQLLGRTIDVHPASGIFVTMNPASKKYGGRSKLPDNLKQLFRAVAMSVPNTVLIAQTMLLSEGFQFASDVAPRVVEVYSLSKQLLSSQQHYDWGLRPLKAVLRLGGSLIQQRRRAGEAGGERTVAVESELLVQSLRVNTLSKLTFDDVRLFNGIISDVFPGVATTQIEYDQLELNLMQAAKKLGLEESPTQIQKALQLHEALGQRMGVCLCGPPQSGKSTLLKLLREAYMLDKVEVPIHIMNPKAVPRQQLLGYMNNDTRDWYDGILSSAARKVFKEPSNVRPWIFCDGDIDPEWVESLNSVLDDNKLLTMPNGVRIQFGNNVNFIFETHSLQYASPATVSRLGIIFLSENDVQAHFLLKSFIRHRLTEKQREVVVDFYQTYILEAVDIAVDLDSFAVPAARATMINASMIHTAGAINKFDFACRLVRALSGFIEGIDNQKKLATEVFELCDEKPAASGGGESSSSSAALDSYYDAKKQKHRALVADNYSSAADSINLIDCAVSGEIPMIGTLEALRILQSLQTLVDPPIRFTTKDTNLVYFPAFFLVGPDGSGKSTLLNACFEQMAQRAAAAAAEESGSPSASASSSSAASKIKIITINCSAQTSASQVLQKLQHSCQQSVSAHGKILRPKDGADRLVLCLKNVNLPRPDKYGTVMLHSLLQQLLLYNGFYDSDLEWVGIDRVQIVGSMSNSAGRAPVTPRLLALVNIVYIPHPDSRSMQGIYSALFKSLLKLPAFREGRQYDGGKELATLVTTVYSKCTKRFSGEEYKYCAFSPRDVTQWALSILRYDMQSKSEKTGAQLSLPEVLAYEGLRLFCDRLARPEDRLKAEKYLKDNLQSIGAANVFDTKTSLENQLLFSSWLSGDGWVPANTPVEEVVASQAGVPGSRILKPISLKRVKELLEDGITQYQREFGDLPLNLIDEMLLWTARIDRVISRGHGAHCVLVGRAGMGRRHALIAAGYLIKCSIVRLNLGREYLMKNFKADLQNVIKKAATLPPEEGGRVLLVVEDFNIIDEAFLEMLNSLIAAGEVPGLFSTEDLEMMISQIRDEISTSGFQGSSYQYLIRRVQQNLRVCLLMDPTHPLFGVRCQSNPAILNRCSVLWTDTFTRPGLEELASERLAEVMGSIASREESSAGSSSSSSSKSFDAKKEIVRIHEKMIKEKGVPPAAFDALISSFVTILQDRAKKSGDAVSRLEQGLNKLSEAENQVAKIRSEVGEKKQQMEKKQEEASAAMSQIQKSMADSAQRREKAETLKEKLEKSSVQITEEKSEAEKELAGVTPKLKKAAEAVSKIDSSSINEIRSLRTPPERIQNVLEAVLGIFKKEEVGWAEIKKFLTSMKTDDIINYKAEELLKDKSTLAKVQKIVSHHEADFVYENIVRSSRAAAPLAMWVTATIEHALVLERIGPLTARLDKLERESKQGKADLASLEEKLEKIDKKVEKMRKEYEQKLAEASDLEEGVTKAESQLQTAEELLSKLTGEKDRWRTQTQQIHADQAAMPRRALASAAFMTYLSGETEDMRATFMKQWVDRLRLSAMEATTLFSTFMRTESELLGYKAEGLPGDPLSIENAIVMLDCPRTALVVDPAGQAQAWLEKHLDEQGTIFETQSSGADGFAHALELAVRFGKTLLVTDVDRIEPFLFNVLRRDLQSAGPKKVVQIGAKPVDWQDSFRLYLFTRSERDLRLPPDAAALVNLINFTVTRSGLEAQLLGKTIQHEQPQLEEEKVKLLQREEQLKMELAKLEKSLLDDLATSQGNLLENTALISSLNSIKTQSKTIHEGLEQSKANSADLDAKRNVYRPLAAASSTLFFLFQDLVNLSRMYQFSLSSFLTLFESALDDGKSIPNDPLDAKIATLRDDMTKRSFFYVSRGLFKADRTCFAVHILHGLFPDEFPQHLWDLLCGRTSRTASGFAGSNPSPESPAAATTISPSESPSTVPLASPAQYAGTINVPTSWFSGNPTECQAALRRIASAVPDYETRWKLFSDEAGWKQWISGPNPSQTVFQRLPTLCDAFLFMSVFLRSQMLQSMTHATRQRLKIDGLALVESIDSIVARTQADVPTLLIASEGADPSLELQTAAWTVVGKKRFEQIPLGGGQTDEALSKLRECASQGNWIVLKNVHLVLDWASSTLEKELSTTLQNAHADFRLWLTTEPHDAFPTVLLKSSLKMTFESPPGVRSNILRTLATLPAAPKTATPLGSSLVFALSWFHALLSERRTYIPQGWTKMYEFTLADVRASADVLYALSISGSVDWAFVHGMLDSALYGGRLDANQDVRVLVAFLERIFTQNVIDRKSPLFNGLSVINSLQAAPKEVEQKLSDIDPPAIFNLPDNADIVVQEIAATGSLTSLKALGQGSVVGGVTADAVRSQLQTVVDEFWRPRASGSAASSTASPATATPATAAAGGASFSENPLGEIPRVPQIGELSSNSPSRGSFRRSSSLRASSSLGLLAGANLPDPLEVFLCSEIALIVDLMGEVKSLMTRACEVVDGNSLASPDLIKAAPALGSFTTPDKWQDRMQGPENLQQWVGVLKTRAKKVSEWHSAFCGAKTLLNGKLDLSDLVRPQTFLNALRQHTARKTGNQLVKLTLNSSSHSGSSLSSGKTVPVTLAGKSLSIQGAQISGNGKLGTVSKSAASTAPFTDLQLAWVLENEVPSHASSSSVKVPLYSDSTRELLVADVFLDCEPNTQADWVMRGAALILMPPASS